jgi:hypothetical protein
MRRKLQPHTPVIDAVRAALNAARGFNKPYAKFLTAEDYEIASRFDVKAELAKAKAQIAKAEEDKKLNPPKNMI